MANHSRMDKLKSELKLRRKLNDDMKKVLIKNKENLTPGTYEVIYVAQKKLAYKNNENVKKFVSKVANPSYFKSDLRQSFVNKLKRIYDYVVIRNIKLNHNEKRVKFKGELVMLTREDDMKIFDFENEKIKSFFSAEEYEKRRKNYEYFKNFFQMTVIDLDDLESSITEKLIEFKPFKEWKKAEVDMLYQVVFRNYINYGKHNKEKALPNKNINDVIADYKTIINNKQLIELIESYLMIYNMGNLYPLVKVHGDFTVNNILLHEEEFYFIDWEDAFDYIFYYDIFNLFFVNYLHTNDKTLINYYLDGRLDEELSELFNLYGIHYDIDHRIAYLLIYLCERITKFEYKKNPVNVEEKLNRYVEIVEELIFTK